jgi:peptidoglycan/LPS O-acetylase OafA/YrhL
MSGERVGIPHVAALDGLRGLAVAGVLLFHGGHLSGGYLGVDLFFVLSGFLITTLLLVESSSRGSISLGGFWARRARRLLPAIAGVLVGVAVYCLVFASPVELDQIRGDALATLGYATNWRAAFSHQDYWALFQAPSPLQHTWSLAIEEQFYLVWPLVFVGLLAWWGRRTPAAVLVVSLVGAAASTIVMALLFDPDNQSRVYYGTDTRAAAIFVGAALAAALVHRGAVVSRGGRRALEVAGFAGIAVLAFAWTTVTGRTAFLYHGGLLLFGVAAVAVIAAAVHPRPGPIARALSWRPLCVLGLVSYGAYLWHWPVFVVVDADRTGLTGWPLLGGRVAITLAIAAVSYHLLEMPIRRGQVTSRTWRVTIPATAAVLVVAIVVTTAGAERRVSASERFPEHLARQTPVPPTDPTPVGAHRIMVVGNSVGWFLGDALAEVPPRNPPVVAFNAAFPACAFPTGITRVRMEDTAEAMELETSACDRLWAWNVGAFRPDTVLVVLATPIGSLYYRDAWTNMCTPAFDREYRRELAAAVKVLGATGARVALTTASYVRLGFPREAWDREVDCDNAVRRTVARATGAQLVDLFAYTCPTPECRDTVDGITLRPDGVHYQGPSAPIVDEWILDQLDLHPPSRRPLD